MEIKASSVYDKKTITAYTKQHSSGYKLLLIILFSILGFIDIVNLYGVIASTLSISTFVFYLAITVFFVLYVYIFIPRLNYKLHKTPTDTVNEYIFYDTKLSAASTAKGITGTTEVEYTALHHIIETKEYLYLYISRAKALIVDKSTIENNGIEQIRAAIASQIKANKYKIKI